METAFNMLLIFGNLSAIGFGATFLYGQIRGLYREMAK